MVGKTKRILKTRILLMMLSRRNVRRVPKKRRQKMRMRSEVIFYQAAQISYQINILK